MVNCVKKRLNLAKKRFFMSKNIAVILSGCGHLDGSEIRESVIGLVALSEFGAEPHFFAPNVDESVINHNNNEQMGQKRNALLESARISRGNIKDLSAAKMTNFDGIFFPGGSGAASVLCNFATKGVNAVALPEVERIISESLEQKKPIAACCIAPALLACATNSLSPKLTLTLGATSSASKTVESMGITHKECQANEIVCDNDRKVVTTPAYMSDASLFNISVGVRKMIKQMIDWT
ncbi:isoprenoid biosynthesis glyoxalase ElbB [Sulfobacillus acidophilus]|uniref:Isoprenoid biosynthesis glyoxalase ElbB n=1 Tax=Sulfobacillus acidophilus TaxID=53633 RepID=A0ABS3AVS2_9FIRM|nr:isoprenoid biosynthesis glyoxalase ElbB [Sulfobacillus acidophilus]